MYDAKPFNPEKEIRIAFDLYVLGQGVKTGVYRVCDEIFPRMARKPGVVPFATLYNSCYAKQSKVYLTKKGIEWPWYTPFDNKPSRNIDVLISPFFAPWEPWTSDCAVVKVFIAYDLIALWSPQLFEKELAQLVKRIYDSLNGEELIFSISQNTKKDLLTYRPDIAPERIVVMPLAAGEQFFHCQDVDKRSAVRVKYGIPADMPYFLSLATLEIRKNLDQVIKAFSQLTKEMPDSQIHLVLAGMHGWKLDKFKAAIKGTGVACNKIILTGFVEEEDLAAMYSDALCFVYMSLYEGFGLPPLEAMACGIPVIASNTSSLPEVVGDAGILLDPHDTNGLCVAMRDILTNAAMRSELSVKGLERSKQFNWDRSVEIMLEALHKELVVRPKLSIITICYNEKHIEDTCRSVACQTWNNFEWIVVDGGSTDGTLDVLNRYREHIRVYISEKDNGRYDAMNKGISRAKGEYLLFLNGGDYLAHERVLERIFEFKPIQGLEQHLNFQFDADILYGEVISKETGMMPWPIWTVGPQQFSLEYFAKHSLPHQATFIRRNLFKKYGLYDTTYQFAADYEWFMRVLLRYGVSSAYVPMPVSVYNFEGASSSGIDVHKPHILEAKRAYAHYEAIRKVLPRSPTPSRKKFRYYLPEWFKRPLRPAWKYIKQMRARKEI